MKNFTLSRSALALIVAMLPLCCWSQTIIRGDLNNDGLVDVSDVTMLITYVLSNGETPSIPWYLANVNGSEDGVADVSDVTFLIDLVLNRGYSHPERTFTVNGVSFTMIRVDPGTFMMGTDDYQWFPGAHPAHQVTLTKAYYIAQTEVTQELWLAVMGSNPSAYNSDLQNPVNMVDVTRCKWFCDRLEALTGMPFRLPTEAEWEFAARGGNKSEGYKYAGSDDLDEVAWWQGNTTDRTLRPVKGKKPNELGLYDMTGNAHEWVEDYYQTYPSTPQVDPLVTLDTSTSQRRVYHGGSIASYEEDSLIPWRTWIGASEWGALTTLRMVYTAE